MRGTGVLHRWISLQGRGGHYGSIARPLEMKRHGEPGDDGWHHPNGRALLVGAPDACTCIVSTILDDRASNRSRAGARPRLTQAASPHPWSMEVVPIKRNARSNWTTMPGGTDRTFSDALDEALAAHLEWE